MNYDALRDDQWERLKPFIPGGSKGKRGPRSNNRRFLDALLWMARSGGRWRDLPAERFGPYQTVKRIDGWRTARSTGCSRRLPESPTLNG